MATTDWLSRKIIVGIIASESNQKAAVAARYFAFSAD